MLDQHNASRARSLSLSRGPLLPPLLPREKNPNPNPRIQNLDNIYLSPWAWFHGVWTCGAKGLEY